MIPTLLLTLTCSALPQSTLVAKAPLPQSTLAVAAPTYEDCKAQAIRESRPLLVWVGGYVDSAAVKEFPTAIHYRCDTFPDAPPSGVIISRPRDGELWREETRYPAPISNSPKFEGIRNPVIPIKTSQIAWPAANCVGST